jgi:hypothetical protein
MRSWSNRRSTKRMACGLMLTLFRPGCTGGSTLAHTPSTGERYSARYIYKSIDPTTRERRLMPQMLISDDIINTIRDRHDILRVVAKYAGPLILAGDNFQGPCPFHEGKSHSLTVSLATKFFSVSAAKPVGMSLRS